MTTTPMFPKPIPPPQFVRVVGFRNHTAPPSTPARMEDEIDDYVAWGWTDICMGVTNVTGHGTLRLLRPNGGTTEASALAAWQQFAERCVKRGIRVHMSLWHKPAWHQALLVLTPRLSNALGSLLTSVIWDIEGETLRHDVQFDHRTAGRDIAQMRSVMPCPWGVTVQIGHMQYAAPRVRPYLEQASWNLVQVLGFENAKKSMGLKNPATLPGFYHEQAIDLLDTAYAWLKKHCHSTVLIAAYWQHVEGVDVDDVVGAACSALLSAGRRDVGVFSDGWMRKEPEVVRELLRRTDNPRGDEGVVVAEVSAGASPDSIVFTVDEVALDQFGADALTRPTMGEPMVRLPKHEARFVYDAMRAGYAEHGWRFGEREYELILTEVRNASKTPDVYDDLYYMLWRVGDIIDGYVVAFNCDPSRKYLVNPVRMARNRGGTLIACHPQQITNYVHAPHMGKRRGSLCQYRATGAIDGWRDGNRDGVVDIDGPGVKRDRGMFGRNSHPGGRRGTGSAGCGTYPPALEPAIEQLYAKQSKRHGRTSFCVAIISEEEFRRWL